VALGVEYGTFRPGVSSVIEIAKVDGSALVEDEPAFNLGGGTGMYDVIRETLDCFCIEYSGSGPSGV
jgi:hypothetical protein